MLLLLRLQRRRKGGFVCVCISCAALLGSTAPPSLHTRRALGSASSSLVAAVVAFVHG